MSHGRLPDVNGLVALAAWSGLEVDGFVKRAVSRQEPKPMAVIPSCLHADPHFTEEAAVAIDQMVRAAYGTWQASERINCMTPEEQASVEIDNLLEHVGWAVQDATAIDLYASTGIAVRECHLQPGHGAADYGCIPCPTSTAGRCRPSLRCQSRPQATVGGRPSLLRAYHRHRECRHPVRNRVLRGPGQWCLPVLLGVHCRGPGRDHSLADSV